MFRKAYHGFDIQQVANYKGEDVAGLLNDASIIRNRLKVHAAIHNAKAIQRLQKDYGSFRSWLTARAKELGHDKAAWVKEFKKHFKFVGGEIVGEFLMSVNLLPGAHGKECKRYRNVIG